jgi:hypothetical protein
MYYVMVKSLPIMLGKAPGEPHRESQVMHPTKWPGETFRDITVFTKKFMFSGHILIITMRVSSSLEDYISYNVIKKNDIIYDPRP